MMSDYHLRLLFFSISIPLILILWLPTSALGKHHVQTKTTTVWGVRSTTVNTPSGKLTVNMPDDAALGDTISGTVVAEPAGETAEERQANMDTLEGYVFDIPEIPSKVVESEPEETPTKEPESKKIVTWEIPATVSGDIVDLVLRDPKGNEVTKTDLPVSPPPAYTPPAEPGESDYNLPSIGQAGRPLEITGPFDGEVVNTDVKIGGKDTSILAQSPRKTVVESPKDVIGPTDIELTDGNVTIKDQYRNIALRLSADKLRLKKGEQTRLTVQVLGLEGLGEEIPISLENKSPAVVSMEGGEAQTVTVRPEEIGSEGVYTISKTLTGIQIGPFSISARISPEYMTVPLLTMAGDDKKDKKVNGCNCNKIMFAFPQIHHISLLLGNGDLIVKEGKLKESPRESEALRQPREKTEAWLNIPYDYSIKCTGKYKSECNAEVKVQAKPIGQWTVETVKEEKGRTSTRSWKVNLNKIHLKIEPITCSGKCDEEGKLFEIQKRELEIDVSVDNYIPSYIYNPGRVDNLKGKFELTFTPRYCEEIEVIGKAGRVINRITVEVDIQSEK